MNLSQMRFLPLAHACILMLLGMLPLRGQGQAVFSYNAPIPPSVIEKVRQGGFDKFGIKNTISNPYDYNSIILTTMAFFAQGKSGTVNSTEKPVVLGFYGFDFSDVKNLRSLSVNTAGLPELFPVFLGQCIENKPEVLNIRDFGKISLVYVKPSGTREIRKETGISADMADPEFPLYIVWNTEIEPELPASLSNVSASANLKEVLHFAPPAPASTKVARGNTKPEDLSKVYQAPDIDPAILPLLFDFLKEKKGAAVFANASEWQLALGKDNGSVMATNPGAQPANKISVPVALRPVTLRFSPDQGGSPRINDQAPEFDVLHAQLVRKLRFTWHRQQLFTDTLGRLLVPEVADLQTGIRVSGTSSAVKATDITPELNADGTVSSLRIALTVPTRKTKVQILDAVTRKPVKQVKVFIDFQKGTIYRGECNSGDSLNNIMYDFPGLKYRIDFDHPFYRETAIRSNETQQVINVELEPKPALSLFYFDRNFQSGNLPELIRSSVEQHAGPNDSILVYVSNGTDPMILSDRKILYSNLLNRIFDMLPAPDQPQLEKSSILEAMQLDSRPDDLVLRFFFYYDASRYQENEGKLVELIYSDLTTGIRKNKPFIDIIYTGEVPKELKNPNYTYKKFSPDEK